MKNGRLTTWAALGLVSGAVGCAGNGKGLDQNGQPIGSGGSPGGPVTADFQSIQANVFTPICSVCHVGAGARPGEGGMNGLCASVRSESDAGQPGIFVHGPGS